VAAVFYFLLRSGLEAPQIPEFQITTHHLNPVHPHTLKAREPFECKAPGWRKSGVGIKPMSIFRQPGNAAIERRSSF